MAAVLSIALGGTAILGVVMGWRWLDARAWRRSLVALSVQFPRGLKADKYGRIRQRPLGSHQGRSAVVSVSVARNSSERPLVSGPRRTSSRPISDAGSHCRRRESGIIFATGRLSFKTSISSPASTRRKTSAVWLRRSRAGIALICRV